MNETIFNLPILAFYLIKISWKLWINFHIKHTRYNAALHSLVCSQHALVLLWECTQTHPLTQRTYVWNINYVRKGILANQIQSKSLSNVKTIKNRLINHSFVSLNILTVHFIFFQSKIKLFILCSPIFKSFKRTLSLFY